MNWETKAPFAWKGSHRWLITVLHFINRSCSPFLLSKLETKENFPEFFFFIKAILPRLVLIPESFFDTKQLPKQEFDWFSFNNTYAAYSSGLLAIRGVRERKELIFPFSKCYFLSQFSFDIDMRAISALTHTNMSPSMLLRPNLMGVALFPICFATSYAENFRP